MNSKFLRDLLIAVGSGLVRCPNRVVPILVLPTYGAELWCRPPLLHPRYVNILVTVLLSSCLIVLLFFLFNTHFVVGLSLLRFDLR